MLVKIVLSIIDTEHLNFDTDVKFTADEFRQMVYDNFKKNDKAIDAYTRGIRYRNPYAYENQNVEVKENKYQEYECECQIMDVKKHEVNEKWLNSYAENGNMFLMIMNFNPTEMEPDAESEIRFWKDDSERVLTMKDDYGNELSDILKLKYLPTRTFKLLTENNSEYILENCKLVENRSNEKFPYCFVIIIEKIRY